MDLRSRKIIRLKNYDYNSVGAYFITVCTKERQEILSRIVDNKNGMKSDVILTDYGKIAEKYIAQLSNFYNNISVDKYVIMPNHIHFLLRISESEYQIMRLQDGEDFSGPSGTPVPTSASIQNSAVSKFISTFKRFCNKEYGYNIWQYRSNDHVIRNERDYQRIWQYINDNPSLWEDDCFYSTDFK